MYVGRGKLLVPRYATRCISGRQKLLEPGTEFEIHLIGDVIEYEFDLHEDEYEIIGELLIPRGIVRPG